MKFSLSWKLGNMKRLGDTVLPGDFTARWEFPDDHTVELDIRTHPVDVDGTSVVRPVCEAIRVQRNPAKPPLNGSEIRRLPLKNWIEYACVEAAMRPVSNASGAWEPIGDEAERQAALDDIRDSRRRRRITDELLETVAAVYDEEGGEAEMVAKKVHVSKAQAYRYIRLARDRGFLPPVDA